MDEYYTNIPLFYVDVIIYLCAHLDARLANSIN